MAAKATQPEVAKRYAELHRDGIDEGSALLLAVEQTMGTEEYFKALSELPSHKALEEMVGKHS